MSFLRGRVQWREALVVNSVGVAATLKQELDHVQIASRACQMERRQPCIVSCFQHGFDLDEGLCRRDEVAFLLIRHRGLGGSQISQQNYKNYVIPPKKICRRWFYF